MTVDTFQQLFAATLLMDTHALHKVIGLDGLKQLLAEVYDVKKLKIEDTRWFPLFAFECSISFDKDLKGLDVVQIDVYEKNPKKKIDGGKTIWVRGDEYDQVYSAIIWVGGIKHYIQRKENKIKQQDELSEVLS